jgi:hypothetical protein
MRFRYHYPVLADFLFFLFGLFLLWFGLDRLYFQSDFLSSILNNFKISGESPKIGLVIAVFLGFLMTSGFLINLIKGKKYVLEADEKGVRIYTGSIKEESSQLFIKWDDFYDIKTEYNLGALRWHGGGRSWTKVLAIKIKKGSVEWPSVMIKRNRVSFQKKDNYDKIIIDAWLNKSKNKIVKEIKSLAEDYKK